MHKKTGVCIIEQAVSPAACIGPCVLSNLKKRIYVMSTGEGDAERRLFFVVLFCCNLLWWSDKRGGGSPFNQVNLG